MISLSGHPRTLAEAIATHDNGFNLVRLVCALLVVLFHAFQLNTVAATLDPISPLLAPHADLGVIAVGIFFLVSGMFVTRSWMDDPHLGRFAVRRAARLLPGLVACLLLTTFVAVTFFSDTGWRGLLGIAPWRYIGGNAILHALQYNIPPAELVIPGVLSGQQLNGPLWTLYWEGRMYVMVALIGLAAALPLRTWMRGAAVFLLLAANLFPTVLSGYVWEVRLWSLFLVGMLLQTLAPQLRIGSRHVLCALVLMALNWTRSVALTPSGTTWFGIALILATLALWLGSARVQWPAHLTRHDYSYGIYIYHWPVLLMVRASLPPLSGPALLGISLLLIVPLAIASWHVVEAPALRRVRAWLKRAPRVQAPVEQDALA